MKLVITNKLVLNSYNVTVSVEDLTEEDKELFSDYGNPNVDVSAVIKKEVEKDDGQGGTITEEVVLVNEGKLYKRLDTDFPISKSFTAQQYGEDASYCGIEYGKLMEERIKEKMAELKSRVDDFTGVREVIIE